MTVAISLKSSKVLDEPISMNNENSVKQGNDTNITIPTYKPIVPLLMF